MNVIDFTPLKFEVMTSEKFTELRSDNGGLSVNFSYMLFVRFFFREETSCILMG